eukprot:9473472-Pyramimonas_sp.AAC.2
MGRVFRVGARPGLTYGVEISGMTDAELTNLRREYGKFVKPFHGGVSAPAKLELEGDPAAKQAVAPALQWSRMIWAAVTQPDSALVPLATLCAWWSQALAGRALNDLQWSTSRGPLERAALCVRRVGWTVESPTTWRDHRGAPIPLEQLTPGVLEVLMTAALKRQHELALAEKWQCPVGARVSFDVLRPFVRAKSTKYTYYQKFLVKTMACGGCWTRERARLRGARPTGSAPVARRIPSTTESSPACARTSWPPGLSPK